MSKTPAVLALMFIAACGARMPPPASPPGVTADDSAAPVNSAAVEDGCPPNECGSNGKQLTGLRAKPAVTGRQVESVVLPSGSTVRLR